LCLAHRRDKIRIGYVIILEFGCERLIRFIIIIMIIIIIIIIIIITSYFAVDYASVITVKGSVATTGVFDRCVDYCSFVQETE
jgi:hypothetical protein